MKDEIIQGKLFLIGAFTLAGTSVVAARFLSDKIGVFTIAAGSLLLAPDPASARLLSQTD